MIGKSESDISEVRHSLIWSSFSCWRESLTRSGSDRIRNLFTAHVLIFYLYGSGSGSRRPKTYGSYGSPDQAPDPEHWFFYIKNRHYVFLNPYKGRSDSSNKKFLNFFLFWWANFGLPESGSADPIGSGSNPEPEPKHWLQLNTWKPTCPVRPYLISSAHKLFSSIPNWMRANTTLVAFARIQFYALSSLEA